MTKITISKKRKELDLSVKQMARIIKTDERTVRRDRSPSDRLASFLGRLSRDGSDIYLEDVSGKKRRVNLK